MYQTILTSQEDHTLTITINRPDKLNAINSLVMQELGAVTEEVRRRSEIRAAIITGAGEKSFVAGADIGEFNGGEKEGQQLSKAGQDIFLAIEQSPKPFIAAVNGFALGAGCELAMCCHLRIAASHARFGQPEVNLGLIPGYSGTQRLVQLIGKGRALELLLTANMIDAATALQYGLVNRVVEASKLLETAREIVSLINTKAPLAVAGVIRAANAVFDETLNGHDVENRLFGQCFATEDLKEGKAAFLEKRKPVFTGR